MRDALYTASRWFLAEQVRFSYLLGQKPPARVHARGGAIPAS